MLSIPAANFEACRKAYFCPVKGCKNQTAMKKITNHLVTVHGILDPAETKRLSALAKEAGAATTWANEGDDHHNGGI